MHTSWEGSEWNVRWKYVWKYAPGRPFNGRKINKWLGAFSSHMNGYNEFQGFLESNAAILYQATIIALIAKLGIK